jgi:pilus assembly protein Flp/PilA
MQAIKRFMQEEEGATMIEYALLAALISVVAIIAITGAGLGVKATFKQVCEKLKAAVAGGMACE